MRRRGVEMKKQYKLLILVQLVLLGIGSVFDLQISQSIFNRGSFFAEFFKIFGELPLTLMSVLAALIKVFNYYDEKKMIKSTLFGLLSILFAMMLGFQIPHYLDINSIVLSIAIILGVMVLSFILINKMDLNRRKELDNFANIVLLTAFLSILVINVIKIFWGRMRFFKMVELNDYSNFTPWYLAQSIAESDVYKSFPSGHSANAAIVLLINYLYLNSKHENKVFVFSSMWLFLVQISRIVDGAHFMSDVAMGGLIAILIQMMLVKRLSDDKYA